MNSYPPELLAQLAPVMFVAGLDSPQAAPNSTSTPLVPIPPPKSSDPFQVLSLRLRDALLAHRKVAIWQPEKNKSFQVILVDKDVKFPPRKLVPPDDPQYSTAHSPLSPLTQTSPLHPDGLIAPIWIRKHTSLLPSVFVLFLRIFEYPSLASRAPLDLPDAIREREREAEERRRDSELATEVAQRKKMTTERGIKLTVVLMASRKLLDDPTLDSRLTFIRRQSGLDSRAALFVLSPVSPTELNEFVRSLQQALYEPAVEYYTVHSKRVRRKRNRHSQNPTSTLGGMNIARPLRSEGWTVRYEYKMACFAEFRSEDEVALKHYQDAYEMLVIMFGSTAILPPRTKRWAEAKVLADCINIKIVKLYLYNNEHALALSHHSTHIRHFGDFSRGWGIGEETFEFWSWIARQHRVLAELLEQGTRSTLVIPVHKPASGSNLSQSQQNLRAASGVEYDTLRSLGINPSHALQHPGFYYYMAARCTEMRRSRFLAAIESEISHRPVALSPGFTNEKKVEHLSIINELYTKSYELFKKHCSSSHQGQGRLTLWIAYRIAQTYYDAGKFDMALRFFERIAKTYRREKWYSMLRPLLSTWHACAKQLGDVELSIKLLVEMLGHDGPDSEDPSLLEEDLLAVLKNTVPSTPDSTLIADLVEAHPIFDSNVVFWYPEVKVGERAAFQLTVTAPKSISIAQIPFSRLTLHLSNDSSPIVVHHAPSDVQLPIQRVDIGYVMQGQDPPHVTANLCWQPEGTIVFTGSISSEVPLVLKITTIVLTIEENGWKVDVPFESCSTRLGSVPVTRWLSSVNPPQFIPVKRSDYSSTLVKHRAHQLKTSFHHEAPAYLDQDYSITIEVTNTDVRDLDVVVNILLQPTEIDDAVNWIVVEDTRSSSLIKGVQLGVLAPGITIVKTLHLFNTGAGGDRMLDISIQSRTTITAKPEGDHATEEDEDEDDEDNDGETSSHDIMEHLHMIVIPTTNPFKMTHNVVYRHALDPWSGLANLEAFDESFWDDRRGGEALVTATLSCVGPLSVNIESIKLERQDNQYAKVINSSLDGQDEDMFPTEFIQGDQISGSCTISFSLEDEHDPAQDPIDGPGRYIVTWCRILQNGVHGPKAISNFSLPTLGPPLGSIVALLDVPPQGTLHLPMSMTLTIRNYHPTRSANIVVQLEPDSSDGFVVSGLRNGRVPVLLPGSEEKLVWNIIPIECGYVKVPRISVMDRRKAILSTNEPGANTDTFTGDVVRVIDLRHETWLDDSPVTEGGNSVNKRSSIDEQEGLITVLVLP